MNEIVYCGNCDKSKINHTFSEWYYCQKYLSKFNSSKDMPGGVQ